MICRISSFFFKGKEFASTFQAKQQEILDYFSRHKEENPADFVLGGVTGTAINFVHISGGLFHDLNEKFMRWKTGEDAQAAEDMIKIIKGEDTP